MKKKLLILLLMIMPMSVMAQTYHSIEKDGLLYLYEDGADPNDDSKLFIIVNGSLTADGVQYTNTYFVPADGVRAAWRNATTGIKKVDGTALGTDRWYKSDMDAIQTFNWGNNGPTSFQGIEYFRNITSLTVKQNGTSGNQLDLDLSKNTKLKVLNFNTPTTARISKLNISNTQLTSLTLPVGSKNYLTELYINNVSTLSTALDLSTFTSLRILEIENSPVTGLTLPSSSDVRSIILDHTNISSLDLANTSNLRTFEVKNQALNTLTLPSTKINLNFVYLTNVTGLSSLDLTEYSYVEEINVSGSSLTSLTLPDEKGALKYLDVSNTDNNLSYNYSAESPWDLSEYFRLFVEEEVNRLNYDNTGFILGSNLIIIGLNSEIIRYDCEDYPAAGTSPDFSQYTNLKQLILRNAEGLTLPEGRVTFILDLTGSPNVQTVDLSNQTALKSLNVINVKSVDVTNSPLLENLVCRGDSTKELFLSTENTALKLLNISHSGISKVDLSGGKAPNLKDFKAWYSAVEEINLSDHTSLEKLNLLPPKDGDEAEALVHYGVDNWRKSNKLRKLDISGCSALTGTLQLNYLNDLECWIPLEYLNASGCSGIERFECPNSFLQYLNFDNCTNLSYITMHQGLLTGDGDFFMANCNKLATFLAHRHRWKTMDFILKPINGRTIEDINALTQIQVNGGSYTILENGERKIREYDGKELEVTSRLRSLDLSNVKNGTFRKLLCEDNLLDTINFAHAGPGLRELMIGNNMLLTLDLSTLNVDSLDRGSWSPQVAFLDVEVIKGDYGQENNDGSNDWVALNMPQKGYTHKMDNTLGLYPNLYCALKDSAQMASEAHPWMCKVEETDSLAEAGATEFLNAHFDPSHTGEHIFLHKQTEIAGYKDQDLYGKLLTYQYNTGYNRKIEQGKPTEDKRNDGNDLDPHIDVRVHIWPYVMNLNPASKSAASVAKGLDYFSNTLYLEYDAVIPKGVKVYFVSGVKSKKAVTVAGESDKLENVFQVDPFGNGDADITDPDIDLTKPENNIILPAHTPVLVKAADKAGLYAFQTAWDFKEIEGWVNVRHMDGFEDMPHILRGVQPTDARITRPEYVKRLAAAQDLKANMKNILTGVAGKKYDTVDMEDPHLNIYEVADSTPSRKSVLVYGLESKSKVVGFWPYSGNKPINAHRCIITEADFVNNNNGSGTFQSGGSFYFTDDETTGIKTIDNEAIEDNAWYTLQGVRLNSRPTKQGIYIHAGKKIVIK
ncbi:MAG: hypothetical protein J6E45_05305 [Prevotella sp.]|nr:hypothetical protein [Prevotella sp.]